MGTSQSTNRAAKFSGSRSHSRSGNSAQSTTPMTRKQMSQYNVNRNVKEFSRFWSDGGSIRPKNGSGRRRSESVRKRSSSARRNTIQFAENPRKLSRASISLPPPYPPPQYSPRIPYPPGTSSSYGLPQRRSYAALTSNHRSYDSDVVFDSNNAKQCDSDLELQRVMQFLHETTIY